MKKRFITGLIISVLLLWLAVRKVNFREFMEAITAAQVKYLVPAFALTLIVCIFRSVRWRLLFSQIKEIKTYNLFSVIMVGFLANNLLPARLGDVVMAYLIGKKEDISKSSALGTIFIDRALDVLTLIMFLTGAILINPFPIWVKRFGLTGILLSFFSALMIWIAVVKKDTCIRILDFLLIPLPSSLRTRFAKLSNHFIDGLAVVGKSSILIKSLAVSIMIWASLSLGVYLLFLAFKLPLGFGAALAVLTIVNLGLIIPSGPGFVGTFQFFCVAALGLYAVKESQALGFAVLYHLSQFLPTTLAGFYFLNRENLTLNRFGLVKETPSIMTRRT
jgi:uncharacterized protein (TIRG00374 family)